MIRKTVALVATPAKAARFVSTVHAVLCVNRVRPIATGRVSSSPQIKATAAPVAMPVPTTPPVLPVFASAPTPTKASVTVSVSTYKPTATSVAHAPRAAAPTRAVVLALVAISNSTTATVEPATMSVVLVAPVVLVLVKISKTTPPTVVPAVRPVGGVV